MDLFAGHVFVVYFVLQEHRTRLPPLAAQRYAFKSKMTKDNDVFPMGDFEFKNLTIKNLWLAPGPSKRYF
ncbi:MAG: hypothetical protein KDD02_11635, partial [Phaeodactylibacter sp.]|nr:hypothetical protein [Phaeodactylibacter sp.]